MDDHQHPGPRPTADKGPDDKRPATRLSPARRSSGLTPVQDKKTALHSLYRELLQGLYDAVLVSDLDGNIIDGNRRAEEFLQYSVRALRSLHVRTLISGLKDEILSKIRRHLAAGRFTVLDAHCIRHDGTSFPAEIAISRVKLTGTGNLVFSVRNIEWRKRTEEAIRREAEAQMSRASAQQNFSGSLNILSLADVFQLVNSTGKNGTLSIHDGNENETARISFSKGEVVRASHGNQQGDAAVLAALRGGGAAFHFRQGEAGERDGTMTRSVMNLLLESTKRIDERPANT